MFDFVLGCVVGYVACKYDLVTKVVAMAKAKIPYLTK
jgi:hypothetical protein